MSKPIIEVRNLSKKYTLGAIGATSLKDEVARLWQGVSQRFRGQKSVSRSQMSAGLRPPSSDFWALRDVSFEVQPGDVVGIIGRNGAGKSTLLKILSRITQQTSGEITLRGRVASLLEVGTGFHPDLTGRENIFLNGAILGMIKSEIRSKLDEIIAFAEVEQFIDTPVKRYSSGMYVRLAFAVAAHLEPEILIVDEVLAVGDFAFQEKCLGKMQDVAGRQGRTVLFVSHNMNAVRSLCSRTIVLQEGKIAIAGETQGVVDHYLADPGKCRGIVRWNDPRQAPGDESVRLKSVAVYCEGMELGQVDIQRDFRIAVEYWVLQAGCRIVLSIHLRNSRDEVVITTGNMRSVSETYDEWVDKPYPLGVYCSSCVYPGRLFNDGVYRVTVYVNDTSVSRHHALEKDVLSFEIVDTGFMREEYHGPWLGALRMKLPWSTEVVSSL